MNRNEEAVRRLEEQLKKLPEDTQARIGYIIQGALLVQQPAATETCPSA